MLRLRGRSAHFGDEFVRALITGALSAGVEFGTYLLLVWSCEWPQILATLLASLLSVVLNYFLSVHWVFRHRRYGFGGLEIGGFIGIVVVAWGINIGVTSAGRAEGLPHDAAKFIAMIAVAVWAFLAKRVWLFARPKQAVVAVDPPRN